MRLIAAALVIVSHTCPVYGRNDLHDPLTALLMPLSLGSGRIALNLFFLISGFLVLQSWQRKENLADFLLARFFRIWPALVVCNLITVAAIGLYFTSLPAGEYLRHPDTARYLGFNTLLVKGIHYTLPGVFADTALKSANGSLWTLPFEILSYGLLLSLGFLRVFRKWWVGLAAVTTILIGLALKARLPFYGHFVTAETNQTVIDFLLFFWIGTLCARFARHIPFQKSTFVLGAIALAIFAVFPAHTRGLFYVGFPILIFYLAYEVPYSRLNSRGDISYGTYLYGYPIQQSLYTLFPDLGGVMHTAIALLITSFFALGSWKLIEEPAIGMKKTSHDWLARRWSQLRSKFA